VLFYIVGIIADILPRLRIGKKDFLYIIRALIAQITLRSALISSLISGWPLIRVSLQISAGGAIEILESTLGD